MKILLYDIGSYTQKDLIYYLTKQGCICRNITYKMKDTYNDIFFKRKFLAEMERDSYDFIMSTNFNPIIAELCYSKNMKYISWIYDSPANIDRIEYYQYPTNYIFFFDRIDAEHAISKGGKNIYHLPLAINSDRLKNIEISASDIAQYSCDISFIGRFYTTALQQIMTTQTDYDRGYINALLDTQLKIYGYNFIEEMITPELIDRFNQRLEKQEYKNRLTQRGMIITIGEEITCTERKALLNLLGQLYNVHYYSTEQPDSLSHVEYCGTAYYLTEMPKIFRLSKLNLNPTLKGIQSGIPLRALDILACGGVLFSNYQPELAEHFTDGEDVIMYESIEDALEKANYYLKNDSLRNAIAARGKAKVFADFNYPDKIKYMLKTAGII